MFFRWVSAAFFVKFEVASQVCLSVPLPLLPERSVVDLPDIAAFLTRRDSYSKRLDE